MKNKYYTPTTTKFINRTHHQLVSPIETLTADLEDGSRKASNFHEWIAALHHVLCYYAPKIKQLINVVHDGDETHVTVTFEMS